MVFPKFRHKLRRELKRKRRCSAPPSRQRSWSLPGVPAPPCSLSALLFWRSWGLRAHCRPLGLPQVHLPEFLRAAGGGGRAFLQRIGDAPVSEAVGSAARRGDRTALPGLGVGLQDLLPAPSHSFPSTPERSLRRQQRFCSARTLPVGPVSSTCDRSTG